MVFIVDIHFIPVKEFDQAVVTDMNYKNSTMI